MTDNMTALSMVLLFFVGLPVIIFYLMLLIWAFRWMAKKLGLI